MGVTVAELYRAMSTAMLLDLRQVFELGRVAVGGDRPAEVFCDHRLDLIARELEARGHVDSPRVEPT